MDWNQLAQSVLRNAGKEGFEAANAALDRLAQESKTPWKKAALGLAGDAVQKYGMEGLGLVTKALDRAARGKEPDLSFASLKSRSDFLAAMQNVEADHKKKVRDFMGVVGSALGTILKAIISGVGG